MRDVRALPAHDTQATIFATGDIDRALEFYRSLPDTAATRLDDEHASVTIGSTQLEITNRPSSFRRRTGGSGTAVTVIVPDLDDLLAILEVEPALASAHSVIVVDPDGHLVVYRTR